jgi:hypothetical protein
MERTNVREKLLFGRSIGQHRDGREEPMTTFLIDYFKAIDLLALAGLAALACAALFRNGSVWLFIAGVIVAIWGIMRVLGWP